MASMTCKMKSILQVLTSTIRPTLAYSIVHNVVRYGGQQCPALAYSIVHNIVRYGGQRCLVQSLQWRKQRVLCRIWRSEDASCQVTQERGNRIEDLQIYKATMPGIFQSPVASALLSRQKCYHAQQMKRLCCVKDKFAFRTNHSSVRAGREIKRLRISQRRKYVKKLLNHFLRDPIKITGSRGHKCLG